MQIDNFLHKKHILNQLDSSFLLTSIQFNIVDLYFKQYLFFIFFLLKSFGIALSLIVQIETHIINPYL